MKALLCAVLFAASVVSPAGSAQTLASSRLAEKSVSGLVAAPTTARGSWSASASAKEPEASSAKEEVAVVNINSASLQELCTLPGIGKKKAEAIIALRDKRHLTRVTQLLQVKGIGPRTLQRLKPLLSVTGPPVSSVVEPASAPSLSGSPTMAAVRR